MKKSLYICLLSIISLVHCQNEYFDVKSITVEMVDNFLNSFEKLPDTLRVPHKKTAWKFLVYMEGDNDLYPFALKDLQEMMSIGSNENLTILVQFDGLGAKAFTKRLLIQKDKTYEVASFDRKLDGGSAQTLVDFCLWAHADYPSDYTALVLWNHGSGVLDPSRGHPFSSAQLFQVNPLNNMLELDRSIGFFEYLQRRGVCFNDTFGTYLTNLKLETALNSIVNGMGKKLDVVAFDACLMNMIEIADYVRLSADYMVGSEEVEPGNGWYYHTVLAPLAQGGMTPRDFAKHTVESYRKGYTSNTKDFTQSALDLKRVSVLIATINKLSTLLLRAIQLQVNGTVEKAIRHAIDENHCTHFSEPSYADLGHFLKNLKLVLPYMQLQSGNSSTMAQLQKLITEGLTLIDEAVIANAYGSGLKGVTGISIYFPGEYLSSSYQNTHFYKENGWGDLLNHFFLK